MIDEKKLFEIGKILKPHGVRGEVTVLFNKPEFADIDINFYFFSLDGMYVPFFVEEFMYNTDVTARIKFKGINSIEEASFYSDMFILVSDEFVEEEIRFNTVWEQFIGYTIVGEEGAIIGVVESVDVSSINALFVIVNGDEELLIPATHDFIIKIDSPQKQLYLQLPEGLLDNSIEE